MANGPTGAGLGDPGHIYSLMFHSKGGPCTNPQVDQPLDQAGSSYDQKERMVLYQEGAKSLVDDVPLLDTYGLNIFDAMTKKVQNFVQYAGNADRLKEVWLAQ